MIQPIKAITKTITSDNGKEFAFHKQVSAALDTDFYFANPYHSCKSLLNTYNSMKWRLCAILLNVLRLKGGWGRGIRTPECQYQKLVPYRLAIPQNFCNFNNLVAEAGFEPATFGL